MDFSEVSGLKAYIASGFTPSTGKLVLTRVTEVLAGEGAAIYNLQGQQVNAPKNGLYIINGKKVFIK